MEVLIGVVLMAVALSPILHALATPRASSVQEDYLIFNAARDKMESVLAMDFNLILVGPLLSDSVAIGGRVVQRKVTVALYDLDGDAIPELDAKKITVNVEEIQLEALKVSY
ncbi:MAG: hypothetical protein HY760_02170 [Nitrospirae bacterium]|nr:hypothetical protein [Nitrospirota bacterium]